MEINYRGSTEIFKDNKLPRSSIETLLLLNNYNEYKENRDNK
jgi:hypothetical protein